MVFSNLVSGSPFFKKLINHCSKAAISFTTSSFDVLPSSGTISTRTMTTPLCLIREALPNDVDTIARLEEELFSDNWMSARTVLNTYSLGPAFVACDAEIKAYALTAYEDGVLDLLRLGVTAAAQGQGLGRQLLSTVLRTPHHYCILTVRKNNARAIRLYRSFDFALHGELEDSYVLFRTSS